MEYSNNVLNQNGGIKDNRYFKTSEYQIVKVLRGIIGLLGMAVGAIVVLTKDVIRGIFGR